MREAIGYHSVNPTRLTEDYFKFHHTQQGRSRVLMNDKGIGRIFFDLRRATAQFAFYSLGRNERNRYRSEGHLSLSRNARNQAQEPPGGRSYLERTLPRRAQAKQIKIEVKARPRRVDGLAYGKSHGPTITRGEQLSAGPKADKIVVAHVVNRAAT
jgi:hypothetical protein